MKATTPAIAAVAAGTVVILDQGIKNILLTWDFFWSIFDQTVAIRTSFNAGIAFNIPFPPRVLIALSLGILMLTGIWWAKTANTLSVRSHIGLGLFMGGAASNLIDRILRGGVVDYVTIAQGAINLADVAIIAGLLLLLLDSRRVAKKRASGYHER